MLRQALQETRRKHAVLQHIALRTSSHWGAARVVIAHCINAFGASTHFTALIAVWIGTSAFLDFLDLPTLRIARCLSCPWSNPRCRAS